MGYDYFNGAGGHFRLAIWLAPAVYAAMDEIGMTSRPAGPPMPRTEDEFRNLPRDMETGDRIPHFKIDFSYCFLVTSTEIRGALAAYEQAADPDLVFARVSSDLIADPSKYEPPILRAVLVGANNGLDAMQRGGATYGQQFEDLMGRWRGWIAFLRESVEHDGIEVC